MAVNIISILKIMSVSGPSSINFGRVVNIGAKSNDKSIGGSSIVGDFGKNIDLEKNKSIDPNKADHARTTARSFK
ncbi:spore germination protein [Desmospora profundinema]|uniref:Uncharacterized protein n=1 Tax=Desmospora profundinema TaxID=1571184 RepID=A0ABU1IQ42_9BACL|nr:spore germination protein [Desmospora profundinema]MDR6226836.1 hypothetical protein [Desmospora profundinema]